MSVTDDVVRFDSGSIFCFFFYYRFQIQWVRAADGRFGLDDTGETQASANAKDRNRELR